MTAVDVAPRTIVCYSDISCPWAHLAVYRLHAVRVQLELTEVVTFDMRAFPLELINEMATPKLILDAEIPVAGALEPAAGWQMWQRAAHDYPVTLLLAMEAVEAAKQQSLRASETLDLALRVALFGQSRNISMRHVILSVAGECAGVDVRVLADALVRGGARVAIEQQLAVSRTDAVQGSPHLFAPDGTDVHNPGITLRWEGPAGIGFPVVESDEPTIFADILQRAAA